MVWLSTSWNTTLLDLKPVVLTLEMLLPTTSIIVWWFRRPEMAENIERIMWVLLGGRDGSVRVVSEVGWGSGVGGPDRCPRWGTSLLGAPGRSGDGTEGDLLAADVEDDAVGIGRGRGDHPTAGGAVHPQEGDLLADQAPGGAERHRPGLLGHLGGDVLELLDRGELRGLGEELAGVGGREGVLVLAAGPPAA
jgi:hypothetical protein